MNRRRRITADRGAALVETALIAPILLILLFGVIEFSIMFGTDLDVAQGAREGSRLAAVNYSSTPGSTGATQTTQIVAATCARMELADTSTVSVAFPTGSAIGDVVEVTVSTPADPVTGVFDKWLSSRNLTSTVHTRLEQVATYAATVKEACP